MKHFTTPTADLLGLSTVEMEEQVGLCGDQAVQQLDDQGKEKENYLRLGNVAIQPAAARATNVVAVRWFANAAYADPASGCTTGGGGVDQIDTHILLMFSVHPLLLYICRYNQGYDTYKDAVCIPDYAFCQNPSAESACAGSPGLTFKGDVVLDGMTKLVDVGVCAFYGFNGKLTIPDLRVKVIGYSAFRSASNTGSSVTLKGAGDGAGAGAGADNPLVSMGAGAFLAFKGKITIEGPFPTWASIGDQAFRDARGSSPGNVVNVQCRGNTWAVGSGVFLDFGGRHYSKGENCACSTGCTTTITTTTTTTTTAKTARTTTTTKTARTTTTATTTAIANKTRGGAVAVAVGAVVAALTLAGICIYCWCKQDHVADPSVVGNIPFGGGGGGDIAAAEDEAGYQVPNARQSVAYDTANLENGTSATAGESAEYALVDVLLLKSTVDGAGYGAPQTTAFAKTRRQCWGRQHARSFPPIFMLTRANALITALLFYQVPSSPGGADYHL